jgi:hypothetical protein
MEEVVNTSLISGKTKALELSSDLLNEVRESIAEVPRLVIEDISRQTSFWLEKYRVLQNRDLYRFSFDRESTTPRIGRVPEQPTRMQEKRKATFVNRAPIIGWLLRLSDRRALPVSGTWPTLETDPSNVMRLLYKQGQIISGLEMSYY